MSRILVLLLVPLLVVTAFSQSSSPSGSEQQEQPEPHSLADCEKTPPPEGGKWEFYTGAGCGLVMGVKPVDCSGSMVCQNEDTDWAKKEAWGLPGKEAENEFLKAMHEPSLIEDSQARGGVEQYRLTWLRSFHHPVAIRIVINSAGGLLITKVTSGKGGYAAGKLTTNVEKQLTQERALGLREFFDNLRFFSTYTDHYDKHVDIADGALWVLEGFRNGHYHKVRRQSPTCDDEIRKFGLALMINVAHLKLLYDEIY